MDGGQSVEMTPLNSKFWNMYQVVYMWLNKSKILFLVEHLKLFLTYTSEMLLLCYSIKCFMTIQIFQIWLLQKSNCISGKLARKFPFFEVMPLTRENTMEDRIQFNFCLHQSSWTASLTRWTVWKALMALASVLL